MFNFYDVSFTCPECDCTMKIEGQKKLETFDDLVNDRSILRCPGCNHTENFLEWGSNSSPVLALAYLKQLDRSGRLYEQDQHDYKG